MNRICTRLYFTDAIRSLITGFIRVKSISKACISITLLFLSHAVPSSAQSGKSEKLYEGYYALKTGWEGHAQFAYKVERNDTIYHGPFRFDATKRAPENENNLLGVSYAGSYLDGNKSGNWEFSFKNFTVSPGFAIRGYQLVKEADGEDFVVSAKFEKGKAQGKWNIALNRIKASQISDTIFQSEAFFHKGRFAKEFKGKKGELRITGGFNDLGQLDGLWRFKRGQRGELALDEVRVYQNGLLVEHYFEKNNERFNVEHRGIHLSADLSENHVSEVAVGKLYFKILEFSAIGFQPSANEEKITGETSSELISYFNLGFSKFLTSFSDFDSIPVWSALSGSDEPVMPVVKVTIYPMNAEEEGKRNELKKLLSDSENLIHRFQQNSLLEVGRHAHKEIALYARVIEIFEETLSVLRPCVKIVTDDAFLYLDRNNLMPHITPEIEYQAAVNFEVKGKPESETFDFPKALLNNDANLHNLHHHLERTRDILINLNNSTEEILERYKLEGELTEREERLVEKRDSVLAFFKNQAGRDDFNRFHERIAEAMTSMATEEFKRYARLDIDQKIDEIKAVQKCYREAIEAYEMIERIPLRIERLEEIYTRSVWNAYTFTYMDERIKERLYRVYENTLLPLVLDDMMTNAECGRLQEKQQNMVNLYQRMVELRDQDTREMERQLRRVSDPEEIMQIISLNLNLN
ncbi:MAG: hypothetical protein EA392_11475 [Cryomorphaceae bacterium]|nr:MAG: hypothetical protein EA392_11475 [Cryomorphaceae bacterium]